MTKRRRVLIESSGDVGFRAIVNDGAPEALGRYFDHLPTQADIDTLHSDAIVALQKRREIVVEALWARARNARWETINARNGFAKALWGQQATVREQAAEEALREYEKEYEAEGESHDT